MKKNKLPEDIEPNIKPLVEVLNKVPYITTIASCEGHFKLKDSKRHIAYVVFEVDGIYTPEFYNLAKRILHRFEDKKWSVNSRIIQRMQCLENILFLDYIIEIEPFYNQGYKNFPEDKRENTNLGISIAKRAIEDYLKRNPYLKNE